MSSHSTSNLPQFSIEGYETWSFRVESFLSSMHDRMWEVVMEGPISIMKIITVNVPVAEGRPATTKDEYVEKTNDDYTANNFKVANLDRVARRIMQSTILDAYLPRIRKCTTTMEMWDTLALISQGTDKIKENKLDVHMREFKSLTMKPSESIDAFELRVTIIISTLVSLGKELTDKEVNLKIVRALIRKWQTMKELYVATEDLLKFPSEILFSELKAHEFDLNRMSLDDEDEVPATGKGVAFKAAETSNESPISKMSREELEEHYVFLSRNFNKMNSRVGKYKRYYKQYKGKSTEARDNKGKREETSKPIAKDIMDVECYHCHKMDERPRYERLKTIKTMRK